MFFHFMGQHWFAIGFVIAWFLVTRKMVQEFHFEILLSDTGTILFGSFQRRFFRHRRFGDVCLFLPRLLVVLVEFALAPVIFFIVRSRRKRERVRRREEERREEAAIFARQLEEQKKKEQRVKNWLAENPPVLYYNTFYGITAVVVPEDYNTTTITTAKAIRNGKWTHKKVMMPIQNTYLFVDVEGEENIATMLQPRDGGAARSRPNDVYTGWLSDLDELVEEHGVTLRWCENIFVPFVNEAIVPFSQQSCARSVDSLIVRDLIERQVPAEIRLR